VVTGGDPASPVNHEDNDVRLADSHMGLIAGVASDLRQRALFDLLIVLEAPGIDNSEFNPAPVRGAVDTVSRRSRLIFHNGATLADKAIEERGLAHVGSADDGNNRFRHERSVNTARQIRGSK
jgi:hypothetical protein